MIQTRTINNPQELLRHTAHWDNVSPEGMSPTRLFGWVNSCATNFTDDSTLYIMTANDRTFPVSIAPLCLINRPVPHLELLGARQLGEPADLIYQDRHALEYLIESLITKKLPILLHRLPADSLVPKIFKKMCRFHGITVVREQSGYPYIDLSNCRNNKQALLSTRLKNDLKRGLNKATSMGEIQYQIISPATENEAKESYQTFLQIEASSWKGNSGTALIYDEERNRFFMSFANAQLSPVYCAPILC